MCLLFRDRHNPSLILFTNDVKFAISNFYSYFAHCHSQTLNRYFHCHLTKLSWYTECITNGTIDFFLALEDDLKNGFTNFSFLFIEQISIRSETICEQWLESIVQTQHIFLLSIICKLIVTNFFFSSCQVQLQKAFEQAISQQNFAVISYLAQRGLTWPTLNTSLSFDRYEITHNTEHEQIYFQALEERNISILDYYERDPFCPFLFRKDKWQNLLLKLAEDHDFATVEFYITRYRLPEIAGLVYSLAIKSNDPILFEWLFRKFPQY